MAGLDVAPAPYLGLADPDPVRVHGEDRRSPFLLLCDHAGNSIPEHLGSLGLSAEQLRDHIAWDVNAWAQTVDLADLLGAMAIGQSYSRLVIDCNRRVTAGDSIAEVSDTVVIPGNLGISPRERRQRAEAIMMPYHQRIADELAGNPGSGPSCIVSMHTFTRCLANDRPRPWHVGVMSGPDDRMRSRVLRYFREARPDLPVGDNEPYVIKAEENYTLPVHAEAAGRPYVQFELRNDLFGKPASRRDICRLLADAVRTALEDLDANGLLAGPGAVP
jgi:predicted N-formylglutamate amidohydrolase